MENSPQQSSDWVSAEDATAPSPDSARQTRPGLTGGSQCTPTMEWRRERQPTPYHNTFATLNQARSSAPRPPSNNYRLSSANCRAPVALGINSNFASPYRAPVLQNSQHSQYGARNRAHSPMAYQLRPPATQLRLSPMPPSTSRPFFASRGRGHSFTGCYQPPPSSTQFRSTNMAPMQRPQSFRPSAPSFPPPRQQTLRRGKGNFGNSFRKPEKVDLVIYSSANPPPCFQEPGMSVEELSPELRNRLKNKPVFIKMCIAQRKTEYIDETTLATYMAQSAGEEDGASAFHTFGTLAQQQRTQQADGQEAQQSQTPVNAPLEASPGCF